MVVQEMSDREEARDKIQVTFMIIGLILILIPVFIYRSVKFLRK